MSKGIAGDLYLPWVEATPKVDPDQFTYGKSQKGTDPMARNVNNGLHKEDIDKAQREKRASRQPRQAPTDTTPSGLNNVGPNSAQPRHADPYKGMTNLEKTKAMEDTQRAGVKATRDAVQTARDADPESQRAARLYGSTTPGEQTERGRRSKFGV